MYIKDYYGILEIKTSATVPEIKRAYRRLAHQFHPDKKQSDLYAAAQFAEIKEAYEVLTNPEKKEYYLQQRWYDQSTGKRKTQKAITPVILLKQVLELEKYVSKLDHFRMDKEGLYDYISYLLSDETIQKLNAFNETETNKEIIFFLLKCLKQLPFNYVLSIHRQLVKLKTTPASAKMLNEYVSRRQKIDLRDKYSVWVILFLVLILCLLIYFLK